MPSTRSIFARPPADPRSAARRGVEARKARTGRCASAVQAVRHGVHQARDGAKAAQRHRRRSACATRTRRPLRRRRGRRRGSSARGPAARGRRTACAGCGCAARRRRPASERCRVEDAEVGRAPRRRGRRRRPRAVRAERGEHARRPARHRGQGLRQAEAARLAPLQRQAEQQLEAGRARLGFGERQVLGVLGRPACGR